MNEKELEDYLENHLEAILPAGAVLIGRQIPLPHGRLDLLAWDYGRTYVIELKARRLEENDVGQILRYVHDVHWFLLVAFKNALRDDDLWMAPSWRGELYSDRLAMYAGFETDIPHIVPLLIGQSVPNKVAAAAAGARIETMAWTEADGRPSFVHIGDTEAVDAALLQNPAWTNRITQLSSALADHDAEWKITYSLEKLFEVQP